MNSDHINMFAKAKEIQEGWKPKVGDRYYDKCWESIGVINHGITEVDRKRFIFLPSIEQMAEMWHKANPTRTAWGFIEELQKWAKDVPFQPSFNWPLPIIVLAFIQHKLYGLTWSEEKGEWV